MSTNKAREGGGEEEEEEGCQAAVEEVYGFTCITTTPLFAAV